MDTELNQVYPPNTDAASEARSAASARLVTQTLLHEVSVAVVQSIHFNSGKLSLKALWGKSETLRSFISDLICMMGCITGLPYAYGRL